MLNNKNTTLLNLRRLGLSVDEAKIYLALLETPLSHLETARKTGVNRTKVYRIADTLIKRGLVSEGQTESGRVLSAASPDNLEIVLTAEEEKVKSQRAVLKLALPDLKTLYSEGRNTGDDFTLNTYDGVAGFKQMLWNELSTHEEILVFGNGTLQDLVTSQRWSENHRARTLEAGYKIREIINPGGKPVDFTKLPGFKDGAHRMREIPESILPLHHQLCVYNDTVAVYNWKNEQKVGTEIINKQFADMQRAIFENYWKIAQ